MWQGFISFYENHLNIKNMKIQLKNSINYFLIISAMMLLSSCEIIGGIFKAGMWSGILIVVAIIGVIIFIISKMAGGGKSA